MQTNSILENLIESLKCLPGVGPKSALRLAYYLLQRDRQGAKILANSIEESLKKLGHCQLCNNFTEEDICSICNSQKRLSDTLCVVEMPTDLLMLEQTHSYEGMYFVLMGRLSPLDGIGPKEIHINKLLERIKKRSRQGECGIPIEYLDKLDSLHTSWMDDEIANGVPVLILDVSTDFYNDEKEKEKIIKQLFEFLKKYGLVTNTKVYYPELFS